MVYRKEEGFVLKKVSFLKDDVGVYLFLKSRGKVFVSVPGERKITGSKQGKLEILNYCNFCIVPSGRNKLDILSEVSLINDYSILKSNRSLIFIVFFISEIILKAFSDEQATPSFFDLVVGLLASIEISDRKTLKGYLIYILVKTLEEWGGFPDMGKCCHCNFPFKLGEKKSMNDACFFHSNCINDGKYVNDNMLRTMLFMLKTTCINDKLLVKLPTKVIEETFNICLDILEFTLGSKINSASYL